MEFGAMREYLLACGDEEPCRLWIDGGTFVYLYGEFVSDWHSSSKAQVACGDEPERRGTFSRSEWENFGCWVQTYTIGGQLMIRPATAEPSEETEDGPQEDDE